MAGVLFAPIFRKELFPTATPKNMIKINGKAIPTPAGLEVTLSALDKYGERDVNTGLLQREILGKKHKYTLNWEYIPDSMEFQSLYNTLANLGEFASFTIPNPNGNEAFTFTGYIGDLSATMLSYWDMGKGRKSRWKSLKVNVIER